MKPSARPVVYARDQRSHARDGSTPRALATRAPAAAAYAGDDPVVQPAAAGGDRVGGHRGVAGRVPRTGSMTPWRVVRAERRALDRARPVRRDERRRGAGLVDADDPVTGPCRRRREDRQHGADARPACSTAGPRSTPSSSPDGQAPRADLGEQAQLAAVAVRVVRLGRVAERVDDVLRAEVGRAGRGRVVAVTGRRRPGLEVLHQRPAVLVGERLADERRAHGSVPSTVTSEPSARCFSPGSWATASDRQRVGQTGQDGEHEQRAQRGEVLGEASEGRRIRRSRG